MFRQEACQKCSGSLFPDLDEWRCFQCGTCYYSHPIENIKVGRGLGRKVIVPSNPQKTNDKWWKRHGWAVSLFQQEYTIRQVSAISGESIRHTRKVHEEWQELEPTGVHRGHSAIWTSASAPGWERVRMTSPSDG
jgi:DNA-directed RNA polymerase subunit M/transcription elongation factor TFIIS